MRRLNKQYKYQNTSRNRSSKQNNLLTGPASVFPAHLGWSDAQLEKRAAQCANPGNNVFADELAERAKRRARAAKAREAKAAKPDNA